MTPIANQTDTKIYEIFPPPPPSHYPLFTIEKGSILDRVTSILDRGAFYYHMAFSYPFRKIFSSLSTYQGKAVEFLQEKGVFRIVNLSQVVNKPVHCDLVRLCHLFYANVFLIGACPFILNPTFEVAVLSTVTCISFLWLLRSVSQFYEAYHTSSQGIKV
jgi:hypothetical protein